ncbi:unnamed protein product [Adineta ricciae]|uniref:Uncharacterized protein n=1 Tax=Adineta ricciae TaxID=249248 RepID=A0A815IDF9_ADIRI|nr:unnamed protein product [Adineta ricciae]CAF1364420.1 unnamed protein product [Adineta ricciae]
MNQSIWNQIQIYEICRQHSHCYRLRPPPRLPIFPKLLPTNSPSTSTYSFLNIDVYLILSGIVLSLISICFLLIVFVIKIQIYRKTRKQHHQKTNDTNHIKTSTSLPSIFRTSYKSFTPITLTTNQSPSLLVINQSNSNSETHLPYHNHSLNIYDVARLSSNHRHCSCCSCALSYYENSHSIYTSRPIPMYYYPCRSSKRSHGRHKCLCQNFFMPIK